MATETPVARFTARVAALGVRSMLSFQLYVEHDNLGALNLYSRDTDAFTDESEEIGMLFATHAAVAMAHAEYAGGDRGQGERRFAQV
jgi:GAF domain-containing protein